MRSRSRDHSDNDRTSEAPFAKGDMREAAARRNLLYQAEH